MTDNLYDDTDSSGKKTRETLAELLLKASSAESREKIEKLKKLGDSTLYISGFFSESLQRKIVDVDYYVDMGKIAYGTLSSAVDEDTFSKMYKEISYKFVDIVDVLSLISQKAMLNSDDNILRLLDVYSRTGSSLVGETLIEKGVLNLPDKKHMKKQQ